MSGSVNKVILVGALGKDPECRSMQDGKRIANLSVATSESWKDKSSGERKEKTEWHKVSIFNEGLAKVAESYLKKGSKVYIEGQIQTRKWVDQQGQDRYSTEIVVQGFGGTLVMLGSPANADGEQPEKAKASSGPASELMDDEIPFVWLLAMATAASAFASQFFATAPALLYA